MNYLFLRYHFRDKVIIISVIEDANVTKFTIKLPQNLRPDIQSLDCNVPLTNYKLFLLHARNLIK